MQKDLDNEADARDLAEAIFPRCDCVPEETFDNGPIHHPDCATHRKENPMEDSDLLQALRFVRDRSQAALDGNGQRPWSPEYVLEIVKEIRDAATDALTTE